MKNLPKQTFSRLQDVYFQVNYFRLYLKSVEKGYLLCEQMIKLHSRKFSNSFSIRYQAMIHNKY